MPASETAAEKATAPTTAIGYTQAQTYQQMWSEEELTPELQWPQSIAVFDQMRRTDSQCASVLRAVTLPVRRTPWRIDPNGARPEVVELVADDLGLPIVGQKPKAPLRTKDKFSWPEHLRLALLMLPMGHSYFEQIYRVDESGSVAHLRKLEFRPSRTIEDIKVASDGGLIAIKQYWTKDNTAPKPIPVNRLVAYIHEREGGNWLGTSILRSAYKNFLLKERLLRVQAQTIERNGMGIPLYKAQEGASGDDLTAGKAMATAWRAGEAAGSAVPFGADLVLRGVEGTLPDALPVVQYHDEAIARAVLAHFLNLGTQTGSWALGTTFADFFTLSLQTLAQQIADTATQHIIEDLVDVNFGPQEPAPRLVFDEIGSRQAATAQALKLLVDAGLIKPDQVLDETVRQQYGLPPADPETAVEPEAPAPVAPAPEPTEFGMSVAAAAKPRKAVKPKRARTANNPHAAALATLRRLRGRLSGALLRELDAIIELLADGSKITAHLAGEHNQETHGRRRTGTLGSVLGKLESLRGKLSDEDRSVLDRAMDQLRELESSDVDDDDLIDDEPEDELEDDDEDEGEEPEGPQLDTPYPISTVQYGPADDDGALQFHLDSGDSTVSLDFGGDGFWLPVEDVVGIRDMIQTGLRTADPKQEYRASTPEFELILKSEASGEVHELAGRGEFAGTEILFDRYGEDDDLSDFLAALNEVLSLAQAEGLTKGVKARARRRNVPVVAHGSHDQSTHGRRGPRAKVPNVGRTSPPAKKAAPKQAQTAPSPVAPEPAQKKKFKKSVRDGIVGRKWRDGLDEETEASIREVFEGEFAGLTTTGVEVAADGPDDLKVTGTINGPDGEWAGEFERRYSKTKDGKLVAHHEMLTLQSKVHGQGFAEAFNKNLFDWYRDSGVAEVRLTANISVGGYAWARAGYDWADPESAEEVATRLRSVVMGQGLVGKQKKSQIPADRLLAQQKAANDLLDRMDDAKFGSVDYPTPFELSQLGRWDGAGKDDFWIGKAALLGSDWEGVRRL